VYVPLCSKATAGLQEAWSLSQPHLTPSWSTCIILASMTGSSQSLLYWV